MTTESLERELQALVRRLQKEVGITHMLEGKVQEAMRRMDRLMFVGTS